jgi:hypothetical protein
MVQQVCGDISAFGSQYRAEGTGPDVVWQSPATALLFCPPLVNKRLGWDLRYHHRSGERLVRSGRLYVGLTLHLRARGHTLELHDAQALCVHARLSRSSVRTGTPSVLLNEFRRGRG